MRRGATHSATAGLLGALLVVGGVPWAPARALAATGGEPAAGGAVGAGAADTGGAADSGGGPAAGGGTTAAGEEKAGAGRVAAGVVDTTLPGTSPAATRRRIAVLEFRTAAVGFTEIATRLGLLLGKHTSLRVVPIEEARRRAGADLDARVAACAGEPACIASIGAGLGVDEALLVAVSQLGDAILLLQRVDVPSKQVLGRVAEALSGQSTLEDAMLLRFLRALLPESDFFRYGSIQVRTQMRDAAVFIDGSLRGLTPIAPLRLEAPARYMVRVSKPGFVDFKAQIEVPPDATIVVAPTLTPAGERGIPWYRKWWAWTIVGCVVAGATTAAVLATRPQPESTVPVYIERRY